MKKNGQYAGVDESFIPEDEKYSDEYTDNDLNREMKDDYSNVRRKVKDFVTDEDNKETIGKFAKTGLKVAGGFFIAKIIIFVLIFLFAIGMIIFIGKQVTVQTSQMEENFNEAAKAQEEIFNDIEEQIEMNEAFTQSDISSFNGSLELYNGTQYGNQVHYLLENAVEKIRKYEEHPITVIYDEFNSSDPKEITELKKEFDDFTKYEVWFDYDENGFVNQITISKY